MYYFWFSLIFTFLLVIVRICFKHDDITRMGLYLIILLLGGVAVIVGSNMPNVYFVNDGEPTRHLSRIPLSFPMNDSSKLTLHLDSTYVINPKQEALVLKKIYYTRDVNSIGSLITGYTCDTVYTCLLAFKTEEVSAFRSAPQSLQRGGRDSIFVVTQVNLLGANKNDIPTNTFRLLEDPDDPWIYSYANQ